MGTALEQHQAEMPFGQYRWDTRTDRWVWSQGLFALYGYPGPVVAPTTALMLDHKETESRARASALVERVRREATSYVHHHRIVDARGRTRTVLTVGASSRTAEDGLVSAGFVADLTEVERLAGTAAVEAAAKGRTAISQSQGAVMAVFGLSADAALALLTWYSQNHHVRLSTLCRSLVDALALDGPVTHQDRFTTLLQAAAEGVVPARLSSDHAPGD